MSKRIARTETGPLLPRGGEFGAAREELAFFMAALMTMDWRFREVWDLAIFFSLFVGDNDWLSGSIMSRTDTDERRLEKSDGGVGELAELLFGRFMML